MDSNYLSDAETKKLEQFNEDKVMKEAVRKCLLAYIYSQGTLRDGEPAYNPLQNFLLHPISKVRQEPNVDFDALGKELFVMGEAVVAIETAFQELSRFQKSNRSNKPKGNIAL